MLLHCGLSCLVVQIDGWELEIVLAEQGSVWTAFHVASGRAVWRGVAAYA
jgi:hypothetical protein